MTYTIIPIKINEEGNLTEANILGYRLSIVMDSTILVFEYNNQTKLFLISTKEIVLTFSKEEMNILKTSFIRYDSTKQQEIACIGNNIFSIDWVGFSMNIRGLFRFSLPYSVYEPLLKFFEKV